MPNPKKEFRDFRNMPVTFDEAAKFLGLSKSSFYRLIETGIIPKSSNGEYILGEVVESYWRSQFDPESLKAAQTRLVTAQAELKELELAEERGELHRASAVVKVWTDNVSNARTRLRSIPVKIAPELVGQNLLVIQEKLKSVIDEALKELAEYDGRRITSTAAIFE